MDDEKILALFFARDEEAIAETDKAYGWKLHTLADRILGCREDAEESVSDTYLKAWETIPPQKPRYFFAYLAKLCRNFALGKLDWRSAAKRQAVVCSLTEEMELCVPDRSREREMEGRELGRMLNSFLKTLSPENRMVFLRRYWYVDTVAEIAQRYDISESAVMTRLSRTRKKLRAYLEQEGMAV